MSTNNKKNVCDTCVLLVDYTDITITELGRFKPNPQILWDMQGAEAVTCYNFATREELQQHYYPRLSLSSVLRHGGFSVKLKIEFSAPKLLHYPPNNLEEVCDADFEDVISILALRLHEMGVEVSPQVLRSAQVVRIDFGKNVLVKVAPCVILQYLNKADISRRLDCTKVSYRNEGHSLHFLARHRNVVIYDKLKDIQKARYCKSRAVSSENAQIIDMAALGSSQYLRVEIQLGNSENIRQAISKAGLPVPELTFQNLFSSQICRAVTLVYWNEILAAARYQQLSDENAADLFKHLLDAKYKFLSTTTVKRYLRVFKEFLTYAQRKGYVSAALNVQIEIPVKDSRQSYDRFTKAELLKIFNPEYYPYPEDENFAYRYYIPLMALYSGARLNELCQLYCDDIKKENNIYYMIFTDERPDQHLKNKVSKRIVPIHPKIIEMGFLDYLLSVKSKRKQRVFYQLTYAQYNHYADKMSKWFGRYLESIGISGKRKVFHSFRHTVKPELRDANVGREYQNAICGWEGIDTGERVYGSNFPIEILYNEICKLQYPYLDENLKKIKARVPSPRQRLRMRLYGDKA